MLLNNNNNDNNTCLFLSLYQVIKRMPGTLKLKHSVPDEYVEGFHRANNTFLYQLAFDPRRRKLVPVHPYADDVNPKDMEYAGKYPFCT